MQTILYRIPLLALSFLCVSCSTASYIFQTGMGQWRLMNRAKPVEQVLKNPNTDEATKKAILLVLEAKKFAVEELELEATANYTSFVQLDDRYVSWAVIAANPLKLAPKYWKFPVVGAVPYLGFFAKEDAEKHKAEMLADPEEEFQFGELRLKPDVHVRGVPAYSTLGWFPDPLLSSMIYGSERDIVDLVVHESVHATIWLNTDVEFNERLANFIGMESSLYFLQKKYGEESKEFLNAVATLQGERLYADFVDFISEKYKKEVESFVDSKPQRALLQKKQFYQNLSDDYASFFLNSKNAKTAKKFEIKFSKWDNSYLSGSRNYYAEFDLFQTLLDGCDGSIRRLIHFLKTENEKGQLVKAPKEHLITLTKSNKCPKI